MKNETIGHVVGIEPAVFKKLIKYRKNEEFGLRETS
jgi:hypothetical protein